MNKGILSPIAIHHVWVVLFLLLLGTLPVFAQIPTDNLILHIPFDGNANDRTGNWEESITTGLISVPDRFGISNSAYSFDGINDFIQLPYSTILESIENEYTISLWVNIRSWHKTNVNWIVIINQPSNGGSLSFFLSENDVRAQPCYILFDKAEDYFNQWSYWTLAYDGDSIRYYIDGQQLASVVCTGSIVNVQGPLDIGIHVPGQIEYFNGVMDEIRIYNRALTKEEIQSLYNEGDAIPVVPLNLTANAISNSEITLTWEDQSFNESGFIIERTGGGQPKALEIPRNVTSYRDTALTGNTTYQYRIKAVTIGKESTFSTSASETTMKDVELETGLIAHYPMNGDAVDIIGENDGTVQGMESTTDRFGIDNQSLLVNDKNDYINIEPISDSVITVSMWYYHQAPGNNWSTLLCRNGGLYHHLLINHAADIDEIGFWRNSPSPQWHSSNYKLTPENWYFITLIKESNRSRIFIGDSLIMDSSESFNNMTYPLSMIGNHSTNGDQGALGKIDDIRIYNRALNPLEINALYQDGGYSQLDAGLTQFSLADFSIINEGDTAIAAVLQNFGETTLQNATINWKVNGEPQPPVNWTGSLELLDTLSVSLGTYTFKPGIAYFLEASVSNPNGQTDQNTMNDTAKADRILVNPAESHYALEFDGTNDFVSINSVAAELAGTDNFTIEFWFNAPQRNGDYYIFANNGNSTANVNTFLIGLENGLLGIYDGTNEQFEIQTQGRLDDSKYHHITYIKQQTTGSLYVDGEYIGDHEANYTLKANDRYSLGQEFDSNNSPTQFFKGEMDEVRIWNVARTQEQIQIWMVKNTELNVQPGLVAVWHFGENIGEIVYDATGTHHGQLKNGPGKVISSAPITDNKALIDAGIVAINIPESSFSIGANEVFVTLHNFGKNTLRNAQINWSVNNVQQNAYNWRGNLNAGSTDTVSIGSFNFETGVSYSLSAWTSQPNGSLDLKVFNDSTKVENVYTPLTGTFTIGGSGGDFDSLQQAVDILNAVGVAGAVTFNINKGVYRTQFAIQEFPGSSCENKVTFQSASGNREDVKITWQASGTVNYLIQLDGADGIQLKNLTLEEEGGANNRIIDIRNGANCNRIENCHLITEPESGSSSSLSVIFSPRQAIPNLDNVIKNNLIENGSVGIGLYSQEMRVHIENNTLLNQSWKGIELELHQAPEIVSNSITTTSSRTDFSGILIDRGDSTTIIKNKIYSNGGYGIYLNRVASNGLIVNNAVIIGGESRAYGIYIVASSAIKIYYNTVNIKSTHIIEGRAFFINTGTDLKIRAFNNIFANMGGGYAIFNNVTAPFEVSDYNNIYSSGGYLAFWTDTIPDLAAWQSISERDTNSVSVDPLFIEDSINFRVAQQNLDGIALALEEVTEDIDGEPRSTEAPDMGADEFTLLPNDVGLAQIIHPQTGCELGAMDSVVVEIVNYGSNPQTGFEVAFQLNQQVAVLETFSETLPPGQKITYTFQQKVNLSYPASYSLKAYTRLPGDQMNDNDAVNDYSFRNYSPVEAIADMLPANEATGLDVPLTFSWSPSDNVESYDFYLWPINQSRPSTPTVADFPRIRYTHYGDLTYGTSYQWQVVAKNLCSEVSSTVQTFSLRELPDLVIENIALPSGTILSGQEVTVSFEVKNAGTGNTGSVEWVDAVYFSPDPELDLGPDRYLSGTNNIKTLAPGENYKQTITFSLPKHMEGVYFILFMTDRFGKVKETDDKNNVGFNDPPLSVTLAPYANVQVSKVTKPFNAFPFSGDQMQVEWERINISTDGTTEVKDWIDRVYLSDQPELDKSNAFVLGERRYGDTPLAPGETLVINDIFSLPDGIDGDFYVFVETDARNNIFEHESDNDNISPPSDTVDITLRPPPNLVAMEVNSPGVVSNAERITVEYTVSNLGADDTPEKNWTDFFYLSKEDSLIINNAIKVGEFSRVGSLGKDSSYTRTVEVTIPDQIRGTYYLFVLADAQYQVFEYTQEDDNVKRSENALEIESPDLVISEVNFDVNIASGQPLDINWTIANEGPGDLINRRWSDRILLSTQPDVNAGTITELWRQNNNSPLIPAGGFESFQKTVKIPQGLEGTHYLIVQTDFSERIYESRDDNNAFISEALDITLSPSADLQVSQIDVPGEIQAGNSRPLTYIITNKGETDIPVATWTDGIYFSRQSTWNSQTATLVKSIPRTLPVAKGESYEVTTTVDLAATLASGEYYFFVLTNQGQAIYESEAASQNNLKASNVVSILSYPSVDLAVTEFTVTAANASSGATFDVNFSVLNMSATTTAYRNWNDAIYLSDNTTWEPDLDILVTSIPHGGALAQNDAYPVARRVRFPNGISGSFYVLAVADHGKVNNDENPDNNYLVYATYVDGNPDNPVEEVNFDVELTPPPDLQITNFEAPAITVAGQPITVSWTVQNNGSGPTVPENWSDRFVLSADATFGGSAIHLGGISKTTPLAVGESYTETVELIIPPNATGNYFLVMKTDAGNQVYEDTQENNNLVSTALRIEVSPISDLIVSQIIAPEMAMAGGMLNVSWTTQNLGENPATGTMTESVFLSPDSIWDASDVLFHTAQQNINLPPLSKLNSNIEKLLTGVSLGDYYVLVHTDIRNNLPESNEDNNLVKSSAPVNITVEQLPLEEITPAILTNTTPKYYRIEIPDELAGESLILHLTSEDADARNEVYLRYGMVPTRVDYDVAQDNPFLPNQQVVIPELQAGTYYLMLLGNGSDDESEQQNIELLAEILEFELRSVNAKEGGNTGIITIELEGARFEPVMNVQLKNDELGTIFAHRCEYIDPTTVFVSIDLAGQPIGTYTVVVEKPDGDVAMLENGFKVVEGVTQGLTIVSAEGKSSGSGGQAKGFSCCDDGVDTDQLLVVDVDHPESTRPNRIVVMTLEAINEGNVDIPIPTRFIVSAGGAPLAFSVEELEQDHRELLLEFKEKDGPSHVLRPGARASLVVYSKSIALLQFQLVE